MQNNFKALINKVGLYVLILGLALFFLIRYSLQKKYYYDIEVLREKVASLSTSRVVTQEALKKAVRKRRQEMARSKVLAAHVAQLMNSEALTRKKMEAVDLELKTLKGENGTLKSTISQLQTQLLYLQEKNTRLMASETKIELGEVLVKPANLTGRIVKSDKKYNFVIIDLGKNDGIHEGMNLMVYRHNKPIGKVVIESVYDELCVGRAVFEWARDVLDVGDVVKGTD